MTSSNEPSDLTDPERAVTLVDFLLARIAEDEAKARAATPSPWLPHDQGWVDAGGEWIICAPYHGLDISDQDAEHVTRWQPARVLAECDARRRIVELHGFDFAVPIDADSSWEEDTVCRADQAEWPCDTLRLLALPYADHPEYDEAWRP